MTTKTDRELLELAAKAAGITLTPVEVKNVEFQGDDRWIGYRTDPSQWARGWFEPLTDDGDALRLAVKLSLGISIPLANKRTDVVCFSHSSVSAIEAHGNPYAATRRAIVCAAAAIGETL